MLYVGLDYHFKKSTLCVLDGNGKRLISRDVPGMWPKIVEELNKVKREYSEAISICFEASCGSGHLHDRLRGIAARVVVAHPGQLRLIFKSKKKSDRVDAHKLATLLFLDHVPTVYVPGFAVRSWRQLIEFRSRLIQKRTRVKNEVRSVLRGEGMAAPKNLWTRKGMDWLKSLALPTEFSALRLGLLLEELIFLQGKVRLVEKDLNGKARNHPGVCLLRTIPGIGARTAEALVAYIDVPDRFGRTKRIGSYFGLIPCQDQSAGKNHLGHITKQGPATVRRLLVEASWFAVKKSPTVRSYFERIVGGDPDRKKIAIVGVAHYLTRVSLAMLKSGECWREAA